MYGQIHCIVRDLVNEKFGAEAWSKVLTLSGLDENDHFLVFERFDDTMTLKLVGAVCEILGATLPVVLELFGEFFLVYCLRHGYDKMLRTLGGDFKSFIQNLDSLHALLALTYKSIEAPSFRCDSNEDGSLSLHYFTTRPGFYPIVIGLCRAVATELYNQDVKVECVKTTEHKVEGGQTQQHSVFRVELFDKKTERKSSAKTKQIVLKTFKPVCPIGFHISAEQFVNAFPYHLIFNEHLKVVQCGTMIQRLMGAKIAEGADMSKTFDIVHPIMKLQIANIKMFINAVFMLAVKKNVTKRKHTLVLKGQMMWLEDIKHMIFIASPRLSSLNELQEMNVYLADIPLYDVTRELVLLNQQRIAEIDIAKKLDETTMELKKTSKALDIEKKKVENLLFQMLPKRVAIELQNGRTVAPEKFQMVTILFSDVVTFTNIAAACTPLDIVNMLNDMYFRFDQATEKYDVYKVETIGDAYMLVSGVPERTTKHAQAIADFAMDMVYQASQVKSPATGNPLQIRVGVHSGPVMAGVVGLKMPRYCLFGDTVNTASRMESHGIPGRIHLSPSAFKCLWGFGYFYRDRGEIEVKGKGIMHTYFLLGHLDRLALEPQDEHCEIPIMYEDPSHESKIAELIKIGDVSGENSPPPKAPVPENNAALKAIEAPPKEATTKKSSTCSLL